MQRLLALPERPTAILAGNDLMAIGAMQALSERGIGIPSEVAVVGYDDIALASITTPRLTTVAQPKYQMGCSAVEVLLRRLVDDSGPPHRVVLRPQLVVRGTTVNPE
jgi:DNA-binding LacI/PurR family transcriptional regulator